MPSSQNASKSGRLFNRRTMLKAVGTAAAGGVLNSRLEAADTSPAPALAPSHQSAPVSSLSKPIVETTAGKVRGYSLNGTDVFKGIPYGAPTHGAQRFLAPAKPQPWSGVRSCLSYGRACPLLTTVSENGTNQPRQDEDAFLLYRSAGPQGFGEDCLRLNIWTPATNSNRKLPVMVYMHGGGYTQGCSNDLLSYDGENLARRHDVVVVTHNHRLNLFGFLHLAELGGEKYNDSANVSMLDIVAVLQWVKENISNFGGDPGNVMIYGQSGGGGKVSTLMAMPSAQGLFHKAAVQSGSPRGASKTPDSKMATALLDELGIGHKDIDKLQQVPVEPLLAAYRAALQKIGANALGGFGPVVDGRILPTAAWDKDAPSISANVPLIVGTNLNESVSALDNQNASAMTNADLIARLTTTYKDKAPAIADAYRKEYPKESPFTIWAAISAAEVRRAALAQAEKKAALNAAPAFHYIYGWRTPALDGRPGTFHSAEIAMVFDNADKCVNYSCLTPESLELSTTMSRAWTSLARTGNPNHSSLPNWPTFDPRKRSTMFFNAPCTVKEDPEGPGLRLLAEG